MAEIYLCNQKHQQVIPSSPRTFKSSIHSGPPDQQDPPAAHPYSSDQRVIPEDGDSTAATNLSLMKLLLHDPTPSGQILTTSPPSPTPAYYSQYPPLSKAAVECSCNGIQVAGQPNDVQLQNFHDDDNQYHHHLISSNSNFCIIAATSPQQSNPQQSCPPPQTTAHVVHLSSLEQQAMMSRSIQPDYLTPSGHCPADSYQSQSVLSRRNNFSIRTQMEGSTVFLTGCTGYLGSLVLEQLLRTCPGVQRVYVLARGKSGRSGASAHERVHRMLHTSPLFNLVREASSCLPPGQVQDLLSKVVVVEGGLSLGKEPQIAGIRSSASQGCSKHPEIQVPHPVSNSPKCPPLQLQGPTKSCTVGTASVSSRTLKAGPLLKSCFQRLLCFGSPPRLVVDESPPPPLPSSQPLTTGKASVYEAVTRGAVSSSASELRPTIDTTAQAEETCTGIAGKIAGNKQISDLGTLLGVQDDAVLEQLLSNTTHVIHCAARIALEEDIQTTLRHNYCGTKELLQLVHLMPNLESFVHVSSSYANVDSPAGSTVEENVYPLMFGNKEIDYEDQVAKLLSCTPQEAHTKANALLKLWGFPNTYTMGKRLTELLVKDFDLKQKLERKGAIGTSSKQRIKVAIVRPSFIGAVAGAPCPGYSGNLAGPSGFLLAYGLGFFIKGSAAWSDSHLMDSIPGDTAASVVLAAAAATSAREYNAAGYVHDDDAVVLHQQQGLHGVEMCGSVQLPGSTYKSQDVQHGLLTSDDLLVIHAASSTTNPIFNQEARMVAYNYFKRYPSRFRIFPYKSYIPAENLDSPVIVTPDPAMVERAKSKVRRRVLLLAAVLQLLGKGREATKLRIGLRQWDEGNSVKNDLLLFFSSDAALRLESALGTEERELFPLVWRGDWHKYAECYISQIAAKYLGGEVRGSIGNSRTAGLSGSISARIGSFSKMKKRGN